MKYDVHIYAVVRVQVKGIEADDHADAIKAADKTNLWELFPGRDVNGEIETEFAEEVTGYLVDEQGDTEYQHTRGYCSDGATLQDGSVCSLCCQPLQARINKAKKANDQLDT